MSELIVKHPTYGIGAASAQGNKLRVRFVNGRTFVNLPFDGLHVLTAPEIIAIKPRSRAGRFLRELILRTFAPAPSDRTTPAEKVADELFRGVRQCPDKTVMERCYREFLIGLIANHAGLQRRAWGSMLAIARRVTKGLYDPNNSVGFQRGKKPFVPDSGAPAAESLAAEIMVRSFRGEIKMDPRFWGRLIRNRRIDEVRKASAAYRRAVHTLELGTRRGTDDDNEDTPFGVLGKDELFEMWKHGHGRQHRKPRSDKGQKRGPNSKVRSDKGKPRK